MAKRAPSALSLASEQTTHRPIARHVNRARSHLATEARANSVVVATTQASVCCVRFALSRASSAWIRHPADFVQLGMDLARIGRSVKSAQERLSRLSASARRAQCRTLSMTSTAAATSAIQGQRQTPIAHRVSPAGRAPILVSACSAWTATAESLTIST